MSKPMPLLPCIALFLIILSMLACGGGSRQLQSINVTPAGANGQVQFTATGTYADGGKVSPLTVLWTINNPWSLTPSNPLPGGVSVDSAGRGQCTTFVGTVAIFATAPVDSGMPLSQMTMTTKQVSGMAQLTCP